MSRLISIGNYFGAHKPFTQIFKEVIVIPLESSFDFKAEDTVLFGGGADISPTIYGHRVSRMTSAGSTLSHRDANEVRHFDAAVKAGAGIIGICRGAQLACAKSGGSLIQHVDNHSGGDHKMTTNEGETIWISSVHHQMMNPFSVEHELLASSTDIRSDRHIVEGEVDIKVEVEPEVVFFPQTRALAIQYHPEFMDFNSEGVKYALRIAKEKFIDVQS